MKKSFASILLATLMAVTAFAGTTSCTSTQQAPTQIISQDGSAYRTVNLTETDYPDLTYAAESSVDAVVFVKVTISRRNDMDPFLRYFFGLPDMQQGQGSGSGVIIRQDGYIVTNNHVVSGATKVEVTLNNNKTYEATVVGTDPATDVALIKIDAEGLPVVPFGDSDNLRLGEWVLAIGSPLGEELRGTITAGIVSAKGRSMPSQDGSFKIESFIQTDAAVNPGNSGGALVNKKGELVGINTAIVSQTGAYSGYSFAVPVNIVKKIVGDLIDFGTVKRAMLGVRMGTVTPQIAEELKLPDVSGAYVDSIDKGSAADKAGMKKGDVIVDISGTKITTASELQAKVNSYHPGDKAEVTVIRDGKKEVLNVEFQDGTSTTGTVDEDGAIAFYGSKIKTADKETLREKGLSAGVEVVSLGPGKLQDAGVPEGFIILYVNDQPVAKAEDVMAVVKKSKRGIYLQGVTPAGKSRYYAFGKDESND